MQLWTLIVALAALIVAVLAFVRSGTALRRRGPGGAGAARAGGGAGAAATGGALQQPAASPLPADLREGLGTALRHVSVVRYDAFDDVKGRQSFTAAILDDNGDGIVITSLHSRSEARTLLKGVTDGAGDGLSPEEQQAVDAANGKRG
ncbi:MAG: DUF4446 family protein [Actinobacteria bacterium]|nr:MAG: DUF4446 family protein [Actinomycetota bacterium]